MKDIREMFNISYFDNKELSLKEHCDIYSNIKKELISILNKYDIKYVLAETEVIKDLSKENQELKKQLTTYQILHRDCKVDNLKNISKIEEMENQQKEFISYLENEIYSIEPKGTGINYNCEYDSEEDYISAMKEQSKLNTLKEILSKYKEIIGVSNENNIS